MENISGNYHYSEETKTRRDGTKNSDADNGNVKLKCDKEMGGTENQESQKNAKIRYINPLNPVTV